MICCRSKSVRHRFSHNRSQRQHVTYLGDLPSNYLLSSSPLAPMNTAGSGFPNVYPNLQNLSPNMANNNSNQNGQPADSGYLSHQLFNHQMFPSQSIPSQQKRQSSISAYMNNPSNKRTANPLQMQLSMQSNVPGSQQLGSVNPASPSGRFVAAPQRGKLRKSIHFPNQSQGSVMKTPTPSTYDVPSSPNVTQSTAQNNSDLSDSSPMVDPLPPTQRSNNKDTPDLISNPSAINLQHQQPPPKQQLQHNAKQLVQMQSDQPATPQIRVMSDEEQQLATKLKETYKNIVNFEEIVQKSIVELTIKMNLSSNMNSLYSASLYMPQQHPNSGTSPSFQHPMPTNCTELSNTLWTIYHHNITLLNNYYDFLTTALKPTTMATPFKTGKNIIDLYKIPRRMWIYGIVGFLELLKNIMSLFLEHEVFLCFIAHCFSIVSSLTDPSWEMEGWWCEKLGDISRMAIALYSSRFIDWKSSAEYWYWNSLKTLYGHGKMYYHMSTVQQDNLEALVNISKAVNCRDPFVPTSQYLKLVVENICTQRNILSLLELPIIDFIKIHKVLLCINNNSSNGMSSGLESFDENHFNHGVDLVSRYAMSFGSDSHGYNFFLRQYIYPSSNDKYGSDPFTQYLKQQHEQDQQANSMDAMEKMNFWFNKGPLFAIANINHLIGFGDARNPFAKLFGLPEALRERKDKKERKRKSKSGTQDQPNAEPFSLLGSLSSGVDSSSVVAADLSVSNWFYCLAYLDKSVLELCFRILNYYLIGPKQASTCHVIVWLYFLVSLGEGMKKYPESKNMFLWLFRKFFPWEAFINYMNAVTANVRNTPHLNDLCRNYILHHPDYVSHFNENEFLPEVWKCWGTLWFDFICTKYDYEDFADAGVVNHGMFDLPICGTSPMINFNLNSAHYGGCKARDRQERDNDERLIRVVLMGRILADNYDFGFVRTPTGFKFDEQIYKETESDALVTSASPELPNDLFMFLREVIHDDARLAQRSFVIPISAENLASMDEQRSEVADLDSMWFQLDVKRACPQHGDEPIDEEEIIDDDDALEGYANSDLDENAGAFYQMEMMQDSPDDGHLQDQHYYHHLHHQRALMNQVREGNFDDYYNDNYVLNADLIPVLRKDKAVVEGDLGDRMDSSITYITFDTNIWLKHCGRIFKCVQSGAIKVLIPLIVFQELRSLRKSTEATISDAATRCVIIIRELYASKKLEPLRFDGTVASDINEVTEFENNPAWLNNVDLTVLNVVNEHDEVSRKLMKGLHVSLRGQVPITLDSKLAKIFRYCVLITDDRNMRLRAKTTGLCSFQSRWLFGQLEIICPEKCID